MGDSGSAIIMIVVFIGIMYFMMIRPENKRKKKAEEMRNSLKKGDVVTTIGGMIGKVVSVSENTLVVETSEDRVRVEFAKWAISSVNDLKPEDKKAEKKEKAEEPAEKE